MKPKEVIFEVTEASDGGFDARPQHGVRHRCQDVAQATSMIEAIKSRTIMLFFLLCASLIACAESPASVSFTDVPSVVGEETDSHVEVVQSPHRTEDSLLTRPLDDESPRDGGVMVIEAAECGIADPAIDVASSPRGFELRLVNEIHSGLMRVVEDPEVRIEPELAESFKVTEDGRRYEFLLRKDLRFSDGGPLTAADVKWSWERSLRKSTGHSRANNVLGWIEGAEGIVSGDSQELIGVEAVDDRRLNVYLTEPRVVFPMLLTDPVAAVLKRDNVEDWDDVWVNDTSQQGLVVNTGVRPRSLPVGAGPFKLTEYTHPEESFVGWSDDYRCVLEPNGHYWSGHPHLDAVVVNVVPGTWEQVTLNQRAKLDTGKIDFGVVYGESVGETQSLARSSRLRLARMDLPPRTRFLVFNDSVPPFDDYNFRRALAMVIDREAAHPPNASSNLIRLLPESVSGNRSGALGFDFQPKMAKSELGMSKYAAGIGDLKITYYDFLSFGSIDDYLATSFNNWQELLGVGVGIRKFELLEDEDDPESLNLTPPLNTLQMREVRFWSDFPSPRDSVICS